FNFLESDSGDLYNQIVENAESGEYEDFIVTYWQVTNVDTLQQGVYMVTMDREYQYGDGETISDEVTYAIRETDGELAIIDQEPEGNDDDDNGEDDPLAEIEPTMNGFFDSLVLYYQEGDEAVFEYLE